MKVSDVEYNLNNKNLVLIGTFSRTWWKRLRLECVSSSSPPVTLSSGLSTRSEQILCLLLMQSWQIDINIFLYFRLNLSVFFVAPSPPLVNFAPFASALSMTRCYTYSIVLPGQLPILVSESVLPFVPLPYRASPQSSKPQPLTTTPGVYNTQRLISVSYMYICTSREDFEIAQITRCMIKLVENIIFRSFVNFVCW